MSAAVADARLGNPDWADNWSVGAGMRFELIEMATRKVWICQQLVEPDLINAVEIPNPSTVVVLDGGFGFHGPVPRSVIDEVAVEVTT